MSEHACHTPSGRTTEPHTARLRAAGAVEIGTECRDCGRIYPPDEEWTVFDHTTGLNVRGYCSTCGPARAILR